MSESMHLLTGAYAVNALDDAERAAFEEHLAGCPDCAAEVRVLLETTARLAAAEAVEPPARLRAAVMAQIASTRQLPPQLPSPAPVTAPSRAPIAAAADRSDDGVVVPMRRPGWGWAQRSLAVAAALLAVVAVGLSALLAQSNSTRSSVDAQQAAITRVLTAPDAKTIGGAIPGGGRGAVVVSAREGTAVFVGSHLAAPPSGHTYELWYVTGSGAAIPAGTFQPAADGRVTAVLDGSVGDAAKVAMTVEPAGGSKQPTTTPLMAVPIA